MTKARDLADFSASTGVVDADIGVTIQAYDADLTSWAGKTAPTGDAVGTSDTQTLTNKTFTGYTETVYNLTGTAIDPVNGTVQYKTLSANTTFTESLSNGQSVILRIEGGATYTITWPTMTWITSGGNVAPTLNGTKDVVVLWQENSVVYGAYVGYGA